MVQRQIAARGVDDPRVLRAMREVKRHLFVPRDRRDDAYEDHPVPIGKGQTISQPYIVGLMTDALDVQPSDTIIEIGTGSGYQAAILGELAKDVYTIEIVPWLGRRARKLLQHLGYDNVHVRVADGYKGWPDHAPFDKIILTAAPPEIPQPLIDQLKKGGVLIAPYGPRHAQKLVRIKKSKGGHVTRERLLDVRFVPMTGKAQEANEK
jgi:protein-L-isoaspartate(D-aspartate) O-methyltransferase